MTLPRHVDGFDGRGLVSPADLAAGLGVGAVTSREVLPQADRGRLAGCSYRIIASPRPEDAELVPAVASVVA